MEWIEIKNQTPTETTAIIMWLLDEEPMWAQGYVYAGQFYRIGSNKPLKEKVTHYFIPEPPTK